MLASVYNKEPTLLTFQPLIQDKSPTLPDNECPLLQDNPVVWQRLS